MRIAEDGEVLKRTGARSQGVDRDLRLMPTRDQGCTFSGADVTRPSRQVLLERPPGSLMLERIIDDPRCRPARFYREVCRARLPRYGSTK